MKNQAIQDIDTRFERTWAQLAEEAKKNKIGSEETAKSLRKLLLCLKWSTAYSVLQSQCLEVIKPYHKQAANIIKWFWVEYNETHYHADVPPTPKDFFEWYCASATIHAERSIYKQRTRKPKQTSTAAVC
jgi:hypothetical protein